MGTIASQITSLTIVYSTVYSDADQRKHQSSASLAFVQGIHRRPVNSLHKWPITQKMFPFDDLIMIMGIPMLMIWDLYIELSSIPFTLTSHELHGTSNHWQLNCLFNSLLKITMKYQRVTLMALCEWNLLVISGSPHKGLVMQKAFPCHDIMRLEHYELFSLPGGQWSNPHWQMG